MTREEAIEILIAVAVCDCPILSCDFCARYVGMGTDCTYPSDKEIEESVLLLKGASNDAAISALRQQENECVECSGIVYRQTNSGKIVPLGQRCGAKITPPCYVPDGDGCSYQIYGDNNDEPIDRCKSCPLCQSDKARHKQEPVTNRNGLNEPLTLDELRKMDGEPVWCISMLDKSKEWGIMRVVETSKAWFIAISGASRAFGDKDTYGKTWLAYRHKPEEDKHETD